MADYGTPLCPMLSVISANPRETAFLPRRCLPSGLVGAAPGNGAAQVPVWASV